MAIVIKIYGNLSVLFSVYLFHFVYINTDSFKEFTLYYSMYFIMAICWLVFGIGVLIRLPWARIGLIVMSVIYTFEYFEWPSEILSAMREKDYYSLLLWSFGLIFFISLVIILNIPKIKNSSYWYRKGL